MQPQIINKTFKPHKLSHKSRLTKRGGKNPKPTVPNTHWSFQRYPIRVSCIADTTDPTLHFHSFLTSAAETGYEHWPTSLQLFFFSVFCFISYRRACFCKSSSEVCKFRFPFPATSHSQLYSLRALTAIRLLVLENKKYFPIKHHNNLHR